MSKISRNAMGIGGIDMVVEHQKNTFKGQIGWIIALREVVTYQKYITFAPRPLQGLRHHWTTATQATERGKTAQLSVVK